MEAATIRCRRRFPSACAKSPTRRGLRAARTHQLAKEITTVAWEIDAVHSSVGFAVRHLMVSTVRGHFNVMRGQLHIDEQEPAQSWVEAEVDATSVDTRTRVERVSDQEFQVTGDFTIHGVTRSVTFDGEYSGQSNIMGRQRAGLSARTKINRKDFDLTFGTLVEATQGALGEMVTIELDLEVVPQTAAEPATTASAS